MERKIDEWEKSQNLSLEQTNRTDPPPPQDQTEHVNAVFTGSGKSDDSSKIQKDPPPSIIADPHDHIREFLAISDMFKYGETQSEAVKL
ncbi:hypothetical protein Tco_0305057 [Tanacetum coccineum]